MRWPERAARAAVQSIALGLVIAVAVGAVGVVFGPSLLHVMGASGDVIATGSGFTRVMLGGSGTALLLFVINAVFRGAGDAAIAMRVLWFANAINITLGPCLIFGLGPFPALGVTGAAVATTIGRGSGVVFQLYHLVRPDGRIRIQGRHLKVDPSAMTGILRISGTAMVQNFIGTASWMGLMRILTGFGSAAVAGNTIGIRIIVFALLPSFGVSNAAVTLVGQNLGAGKPDRAEAAAWRAGWYNTICLGTIGALFLLFAPALVGIFSQDPEVAVRGPMSPDRGGRVPVLRIRHGLDDGVQRCRRHADPDAHQSGMFVVPGDSARVGAGVSGGTGTHRRLHCGERGVFDTCPRERLDVQQGDLEDTACVGAYAS
jgi:putative MATE family efflux protein